MVVLDENMTVAWIFMEKLILLICYSDPGIILGLFSDRKPIVRDRKTIFYKMMQTNERKFDLFIENPIFY